MFYKGYGNELGLLGHNYPKMSHKIGARVKTCVFVCYFLL